MPDAFGAALSRRDSFPAEFLEEIPAGFWNGAEILADIRRPFQFAQRMAFRRLRFELLHCAGGSGIVEHDYWNASPRDSSLRVVALPRASPSGFSEDRGGGHFPLRANLGGLARRGVAGAREKHSHPRGHQELSASRWRRSPPPLFRFFPAMNRSTVMTRSFTTMLLGLQYLAACQAEDRTFAKSLGKLPALAAKVAGQRAAASAGVCRLPAIRRLRLPGTRPLLWLGMRDGAQDHGDVGIVCAEFSYFGIPPRAKIDCRRRKPLSSSCCQNRDMMPSAECCRKSKVSGEQR